MDREIEYVEADTAGSPSTAQGEIERLVNEDEVDVIIGTYVSEVTQAILDYTAQFGVPFIVTGSAAPSTVTDFIGQDYERYKNFFRVGPLNSTYQAQAFSTYADFLADRYDWNTFGFVADRAAWTTPYNDLLPDALREKGYNVEYDNRISIETDNFTPVLDEVADSGVQGLFRFFAHINAIPMMVEWHERQLDFSFEGIHVASQLPEYWQLSNGAGRYETTSQTAAGGVTDVTEKTIPFTDTYQERFGDEGPPGAHPMYMGFNTYDALYFYKGAVEAAGTWDYENFIDNIVDAMLSQEMVGAGAEISLFGPDGEFPHDVIPDRDEDGAISNVPITQWQEDGALECVYPSTFNTAEHAIPPWMQ
jgi:branched-chain amino acid transport system substrate-binding protein